MISVRICAAHTVERQEDFAADYMISIISPNGARPQVPWLEPEHIHEFCFADIEASRHAQAPTRADIERLIKLGRDIAGPESCARILLHCAAGISRSAAAAFILFCIHLGSGRENEAMEFTARSSENYWVWPNSLMVDYADDILGRGGAMVKAIREWKQMA
jgi:predicted protein tyrosine phosphatase